MRHTLCWVSCQTQVCMMLKVKSSVDGVCVHLLLCSFIVLRCVVIAIVSSLSWINMPTLPSPSSDKCRWCPLVREHVSVIYTGCLSHLALSPQTEGFQFICFLILWCSSCLCAPTTPRRHLLGWQSVWCSIYNRVKSVHFYGITAISAFASTLLNSGNRVNIFIQNNLWVKKTIFMVSQRWSNNMLTQFVSL